MPLDLHHVAAQLEGMASNLRASGEERRRQLEQALSVLVSAAGEAINQRRAAGRVTWLVPHVPPSLATRFDPPETPTDYCALAVDGSHIDVDRHLPAQCALLNIGSVRLRYGAHPDASLESSPRLYTRPEELALTDPEGARSQALEGPLMGMKRMVEEVSALAGLAEGQDEGTRASDSQDPHFSTGQPGSPGHEDGQVRVQGTPCIALVDGSLVLWGLSGQGYPDYVRDALLDDGLLPALERLRVLSQTRPLALAAYVSLPRSAEVVSALRLHTDLCPYDPVNCDLHCGGVARGARPCDPVDGLLDRDLFGELLAPGQRSAVFFSTSSIVERHYGAHGVAFFYLHAGEEIARVEVPAWVAEDEALLGLAHALILDQCRKGLGYPVAIMEAHEQAVITGHERELFRRMVEELLEERGLPVYTSEKARSKRLPWL